MILLMHCFYFFAGVVGWQCVSCAENLQAHLPTFHNLTHLEVYVDPVEYTHERLMDILQKTHTLESLNISEVDL